MEECEHPLAENALFTIGRIRNIQQTSAIETGGNIRKSVRDSGREIGILGVRERRSHHLTNQKYPSFTALPAVSMQK
jgi:hypothetical protein